MRTSNKILLAGAVIAGLAASAVGGNGGLGFDSIGRTQEAIDKLAQGQYAQAEQIAQDVISHRQPLSNRCWLIIANARERSGQYAKAEEAYRTFLAGNEDPALRDYATAQIKLCHDAQAPAKAAQAPSRKLTVEKLTALAKVEDQEKVETSPHFVVHSRNTELSKLVAAEAEAALARVCGMLMNGREYPNSVEIHIWADRRQYESNALDAPEWSGGSYSLSVKDGTVTRRIDLTQTEKDGSFSTQMLDRVLPHELCHLVTREFFGDAACPLFLNEGLAMLSEPETDNGRVLLAGTALAGKGKLTLDQLLLMQRHNIESVDIFYAESYSLLSFLQSRLSERQFKDLLENIRLGCSFKDALHRALGKPQDDALLPSVVAAWESHALEQAQFLRALRGEYELAMKRHTPMNVR